MVVRAAGGFTLLELMIAVVAFAIVLASINGLFYGAVRLRNKTTQSLEKSLPVEQALRVIQKDLASIVVPNGTLAGSLQSTPTSTNTSGTLDANVDRTGQVSPDFYTATGQLEEDVPWADIQRVSYRLLDSTNRYSGQDLVRVVYRNLLPSFQEQPEAERLLGGVQAVQFSYHNGTQWADTWDSTALTNQLPRLIRLQIELVPEYVRDSQKTLRQPPIELVVPILVEASTNQTAETSGTSVSSESEP